MSINLYQTGVSGLLAAQQQLATTGHNIANVNTEGYNRQRAEQNASPGLFNGGNFIGSGTFINDVVRIYDQFSYKEQLHNTSKLGQANASNSSLDQLNNIMSFSGQALSNSIEQFYQTVNGMVDNPSDLGLRSITLNQASILSADFQALNNNFGQLEKAVNGEISQIAGRITDISQQLATINSQILTNNDQSVKGQPNDLLDKRDQLITQLSEYTNVNTVTDQNGVMTVMIGNGSTLVAGTTALSVGVTSGDPDPLATKISLYGPSSTAQLKPESLGGALAGKFEFRDEHLKQARNEINRLAMAISEKLNSIQAQGLDLNQQQGQDLFTDINSNLLQSSRVLTPSSNAGTLTAQVEIVDISLISTDEYEITYDGSDYVMTNLNNGATETLTLTAANTYSSSQGFNFVTTGGAVATDDSFIIRPAENSAALMEMVLTDGKGLAASSAVQITPSANNVSAGTMAISQVYDPVNARADMDMSIEILESPPGTFTYTVTDNTGTTSAPQPYTPPSQLIDLPLTGTATFQVELKGMPSGLAPNAPEVFSFNDGFGVGNGTNALALAASQEDGILNGNSESFTQSLSKTTSIVGSKASSAELVANTAEALHTQAFNRNQSTSGVNLDEEAANLIKFQQAYQASSQIISIANTIFDTLLAAAR
ncbi:flagellar hook-associated protein FlgK [Thalassotalea agariperforans]